MALPDIQLDIRNEQELLEQATQYVVQKSGGKMGNMSPANPLSFLLEGQVYAGAELLWYLNKLPSKLLSQWLSYWGLGIAAPSAAVGSVQVQLTGTLPTTVSLPSGILFGAGPVMFRSTQSVDILPGSSSVSVPVEALESGVAGNVPQYSINTVISSTPFVKSATNPVALSGGSDEVAPEDALQEFTASIRDQSLLSKSDYIRVSQKFLGPDWSVRVIPNMDPATSASISGSVAVLIGDRRNESTPIGTLQALNSHLKMKAPITSTIWVGTVDWLDVVLRVYATYDPNDDASVIAQNIAADFGVLLQTDPQEVTVNDIGVICYRSGCDMVTASLNGADKVSSQSVRSVLRSRYIEVRLMNNRSEYLSGSDTRLLYGGDDGQLFIFGQGDED